MTEERYKKCSAWVTRSKLSKTIFTIIYRLLPAVVFISYAALLLLLFIKRSDRLLPCVIVPLFMFVTLSAARYFINAPRPYEKYDITPVIKKDTKGKSFPSRHTASAAVIALTILSVSVPAGIIFCVISLLIAASRVIGGVHFIRDVAVGLLYAAVCASALMFF